MNSSPNPNPSPKQAAAKAKDRELGKLQRELERVTSQVRYLVTTPYCGYYLL